ncbi:hypothetical protein BpHYR1_045206 [Brachionus plicatilis]|uniref:Uncharacterized protein n=1 Tax=Brachionus plicatilis TaxID=10195 RepID=A0A3M7SRM1_BRAPC|nr:hypothetical protein BpHYR1_045206 [Brachionus plicatilis]
MIITRNQGLYKQGFYSAKKEVQVKSVNETSRRQRRPIQLDHFIDEINFNVARLLKTHRKLNQYKSFKINITRSLFLYLKSKYCLSSRYKQVSGFFEDFGILRERYMNDSDINSIDIESYEVIISNSKIQRVLDKSLKENVYRGLASIGFRFLVKKSKADYSNSNIGQ